MKLRSIIQLDGWKIAVSWPSMYYMDSFFVPSTNWRHDKKAIRKSAREFGCKLLMKISYEDDIQGIRVWILEPITRIPLHRKT